MSVIPQLKEGVDCLVFEILVAFGLLATHAPDHLNIKPYHGIQTLIRIILSEYIAEVQMEELAVWFDHHILQMSVSNS